MDFVVYARRFHISNNLRGGVGDPQFVDRKRVDTEILEPLVKIFIIDQVTSRTSTIVKRTVVTFYRNLVILTPLAFFILPLQYFY